MRLSRSAAGAVVPLVSTTDALAAELSGWKASLINTDRCSDGTFGETPNGALMRFALQNRPAKISPGARAAPLHEVGQCEPPFKSLGAPLNATGAKYIFSQEGRPSRRFAEYERAQGRAVEVRNDLTGGLVRRQNNVIDADGLARVIHRRADDYNRHLARDSGDRIVCAVIDGSRPAK